MSNVVWSIPLPDDAIKMLQSCLVKDGKPVHFTNSKGDTVELTSGNTQPRHINNMQKVHYFSFNLETIRLIEQNTGLTAHISE